MLVWIQNTFAFVNGLHFLCGSCALFMGPTSMNFIKFFFKTRSNGTIYTFKNYFSTVFSVFYLLPLYPFTFLTFLSHIKIAFPYCWASPHWPLELLYEVIYFWQIQRETLFYLFANACACT